MKNKYILKFENIKTNFIFILYYDYKNNFFSFYELMTLPELSLTKFLISSSVIIAPFCFVNFSSSFLKSCASISSFFFWV